MTSNTLISAPPSSSANQLNSDLPITDPRDDEFGYASFAGHVAKAIAVTPTPQGLVTAIYGEWGAGKSSILNFIKSDLKNLPDDTRPIMITFNPWWFTGREDLASQLLQQFTKQLPAQDMHLSEAINALTAYHQELTPLAIAWIGHASAFKGIPLLAKWLERRRRSKEDIKAQKETAAEALLSSGRRFVVFVDDIDRLTPDEAKELFRAIKALADFPQVIYVLAFDRDIIAKSLTAVLHTDGSSYLEKIVQVPFHLPAIDRSLLLAKLTKGLDSLLKKFPSSVHFSDYQWAKLHQGLFKYIRKPRDVVRIINALTITYPPVAKEVNPVDFISIEFLAVFEPNAYSLIKDNANHFAGASPRGDLRAEETQFFEHVKTLIEPLKNPQLTDIICALFPRAEKALTRSNYEYLDTASWRKDRRICTVDFFPLYFSFSVPKDHIALAELRFYLLEANVDEIVENFTEAQKIIFRDGQSKARHLISALRDFDQDTNYERARVLIQAIFKCGDSFYTQEGEELNFTMLPGRWLALGLVSDFLARVAQPKKEELISEIAKNTKAIALLTSLVDVLDEGLRTPSKVTESLRGFNEAAIDSLKLDTVNCISSSSLTQLMETPDLDFVLTRWKRWDGKRLDENFIGLANTDEGFLKLLDKFVRVGQSSDGKEIRNFHRLSMNPLSYVINVEAYEHKARTLLQLSNLTVRQTESLKAFLDGVSMIKQGVNPDPIDLFD